jgi:hypothetical protein
MAWLRDFHQNLSYKLGYGRGLENRRPFACPWWVDQTVYGLAYMDGYKAYLLANPKN